MPIQGGHPIPWANQACIACAYYYLDSRYYSNIEPSATSGLVGVGSISGFPNFSAALTTGGFDVDDIHCQLVVSTLGNDIEGQGWMYDAGTQTETRYYTGGEYMVRLRGSAMIGEPLPLTTKLIDYNDLNNCVDDQISGFTDADRPRDLSAGSSAAIQAAVSAFLQDLGNDGTRSVFDSFQRAGQFQFSGSGRNGGFFEIQTGALETASIPVADVRPFKSASTSTAQRGDTVTYMLTIINDGPATATNLSLYDMLPNGLNFTSTSPTSAGCVQSMGNVDCDLGDLSSGASTTVFVSVRIDANATGSLVNGGLATSTTFDNDQSNTFSTSPLRQSSLLRSLALCRSALWGWPGFWQSWLPGDSGAAKVAGVDNELIPDEWAAPLSPIVFSTPPNPAGSLFVPQAHQAVGSGMSVFVIPDKSTTNPDKADI